MGIKNGVWIHVELDRHPQHSCGDSVVPSYDPQAPTYPYFHNFAMYYMDLLSATGASTVWVDEVKFWTQILCNLADSM